MTETGALLSLRYDLRAPSFGAPAEALYRAALEQCAWAEEHGFLLATLSEHHGSDDGYCPSPLVMAAAIAGRTRNLRIMVAAPIVPLYDPIRLAEDLAVLDLASGGRVDLILGAGYRPEEMAMFGQQLDDRIPLVEEGIAVLRTAWTGEEFDYRGRRGPRTPRPARHGGPDCSWAVRHAGRRRRAGPPRRRLRARRRLALARLRGGVPRAGQGGRQPAPALEQPRFIHVADDPDEAWARIAPHALHETNAYGAWLASADALGPYAAADDADALRAAATTRADPRRVRGPRPRARGPAAPPAHGRPRPRPGVGEPGARRLEGDPAGGGGGGGDGSVPRHHEVDRPGRVLTDPRGRWSTGSTRRGRRPGPAAHPPCSSRARPGSGTGRS